MNPNPTHSEIAAPALNALDRAEQLHKKYAAGPGRMRFTLAGFGAATLPIPFVASNLNSPSGRVILGVLIGFAVPLGAALARAILEAWKNPSESQLREAITADRDAAAATHHYLDHCIQDLSETELDEWVTRITDRRDTLHSLTDFHEPPHEPITASLQARIDAAHYDYDQCLTLLRTELRGRARYTG